MANERGDRPSKFSRIKQRRLTTDLGGGKAFTEFLTPRRNNLAETEAVDFQSDLFSFATALDPTPLFLRWIFSGRTFRGRVWITSP